MQPTPQVDPALIASAPAILEAVSLLISHPGLDELQKAIAAEDEHALSALVQLADGIGMTCDVLIKRCKQWNAEGNWAALDHEAELAARLAATVEWDYPGAMALIFLGNARKAAGDHAGTIEAYEAAIRASVASGDEHLLSVAEDSLGIAFLNIGMPDEALQCHEEAFRHELDPKGRYAILINKSNALMGLGEFRSAARIVQKAVSGIEHAGTGGRELGIALDDSANAVAGLGELATALDMLKQARPLFDPGDLANRAINALSRSQVLIARGDEKAAAAAFIEAHGLAFEDARHRIDPDHYRQGFQASLAHRLSLNDEAYRLFGEGMKAKDAGLLQQALGQWKTARERSSKAGDHALALRIDANEATLYFNSGNLPAALAIAMRVRHRASELGLALPELMVTSTIGSIAAQGMDIHDPLGPLGCFARADVLKKAHTAIVEASDLTPRAKLIETYDTGTTALELAKQADKYHADSLAIAYYREAIDKAQAAGGLFEVANRLTGLLSVLSRGGNGAEADAVADRIVALLGQGVLKERGRLVAHRALAYHYEKRDRPAAIKHIRQACALAETIRQWERPGTERADVALQWSYIYHYLARLLRLEGDDAASFEALQGEKARRLIDALSTLDSGTAPVSDVPPKVDEILTLVNRMKSKYPTYLVDLAVEEDGLTAYLVGNNKLRVIHKKGNIDNLARVEGGDVREREARLVELCLRDPLLKDLAEAVTAAVPEGNRLLLVPDQFLHNLPLHIIPVAGKPWCDRFPIGYLPAAGALRFAYGRRPIGGRSLVVGDSRGDLPRAAEECVQIAAELGTVPLLGQECTFTAVKDALQAPGDLDVVHLALHGRGDVRRGERASLVLADGKGGNVWITFEDLAAIPWRANLVVFSGCSTAVAGLRYGHELVGISRAAAERGASAVIACLWPVGDGAAKTFMTAFYEELAARRKDGPVDLRLVFDRARKRLRERLPAAPAAGSRRRDGRTLRSEAADGVKKSPVDPEVADALAWAPFILLGDPVLGD